MIGRLIALALALAASSCSQPKPAPVAADAAADHPTAQPPAQAPAEPLVVADGREQPATGPATPLPAEAARRRQEGLRALDEGRYTEARQIFEELLARHRSNASLRALLDAARQAEADARRGATASLARMQPVRLAAPPWTATVRRRVEVRDQGPMPKLKQVSATRNQITDDEAWLSRHRLRVPVWEVPNAFRNIPGNLPAEVPVEYGDLKIVEAISHPDHAVLLYGPDYSGGTVLAVMTGAGDVRGFFDFEAWSSAPRAKAGDEMFVEQRVAWAEAADGVLYVASGHNTYAESSGGHNAYLTALDLRSGDLLWRSQPLVSNAANFVLRDGWILAGYGFTAEPDFLYVIDQRDGSVAAKHKLKSGPSWLFVVDDRLLVRTYDTDYEFRLE